MLTGVQVVLLILGAALLLTTLPPVTARLLGNPSPGAARLVRILRTAAGVAGAALIVLALASYSQSRARPAGAAASAADAAAAGAAGGNVASPATPRTPTVDLMEAASSAIEECVVATPPVVPDAAGASLKQMMAAHSAFKAYDAATLKYVNCVDAVVDRLSRQSAGTATALDLRNLRAFGTSAHNAAIDQEQGLVDQFNQQVRIFKAKHP